MYISQRRRRTHTESTYMSENYAVYIYRPETEVEPRQSAGDGDDGAKHTYQQRPPGGRP